MNRFENVAKPLLWSMPLLLTAIVAGCGGGNGTASVNPSAGSGPTGVVCAGANCVSLGKAGNYVILAKTGVSTVPNSAVKGNIGLSPRARVGLTGWSLITEPTDTSFTSAQVAAPGRIYAADNVGGTTAVDLTTAVSNMQTAYTTAAGKTPGAGAFFNAGAGNIGGKILGPGVYTWSTGVTIPTDVTLNGTATDVWVFQIAQGLTQASATRVILTGGALPQNIFWQVAGVVDMGTTAHMEGVILAQTAITMGTGATINGRLMAQTAVNLDHNAVTVP